MQKIDEGFRDLKTARAPDLWRDIERRTPRPLPGPSLPRRLAVAALALAIAGTGAWLAAQAFLGSAERGAKPAEEPVRPPALRLGPSATFHGAGGGGPLYAFGSVWVPQHHVVGKADVLLRLDPETLDVQARIEVPTTPGWEIGNSGLEAGGGSVWVAGGTGDEAIVYEIDPTTNAVRGSLPLRGELAGDVAVADIEVWVSILGREEMSVVKLHAPLGSSDVILGTTVEGDWIREVFAVGGRIVVHTRGGGEVNRLSVVDRARGSVVATTSMQEAIFADWDGSIWAGAEDEILRIDPHTAEIVERHPMDAYVSHTSMAGGAGGVWFIGYDPNEGAGTATTLMRFNPETGVVDASVDVGGEPVGLEVGGGAVWVLGYDGTLTRVDIVPA